jgi:MOSC domain-containing protein YiiM
MKLLSVNVGLPREIEWQGKRVRTSIFKSASAGHVRVMTLNVEGDEQSDLSVHGGVHKAVYAYPSEHYPFWREEVPGVDLPLGTFGENFTTEGLFEEAVHIGDRFRVGSAEFIVTQPRLPCFKLGIRFGRPEMVSVSCAAVGLDSTLQSLKKDWSLLATRSSCLPGTSMASLWPIS